MRVEEGGAGRRSIILCCFEVKLINELKLSFREAKQIQKNTTAIGVRSIQN